MSPAELPAQPFAASVTQIRTAAEGSGDGDGNVRDGQVLGIDAHAAGTGWVRESLTSSAALLEAGARGKIVISKTTKMDWVFVAGESPNMYTHPPTLHAEEGDWPSIATSRLKAGWWLDKHNQAAHNSKGNYTIPDYNAIKQFFWYRAGAPPLDAARPVEYEGSNEQKSACIDDMLGKGGKQKLKVGGRAKKLNVTLPGTLPSKHSYF